VFCESRISVQSAEIPRSDALSLSATPRRRLRTRCSTSTHNDAFKHANRRPVPTAWGEPSVGRTFDDSQARARQGGLVLTGDFASFGKDRLYHDLWTLFPGDSIFTTDWKAVGGHPAPDPVHIHPSRTGSVTRRSSSSGPRSR